VITEIRLEGNKDTKEKLIRAAMKSQVGEMYTLKTATLD
jgi:outer membrane protein assembly factor BamA